MVFSIRFCTLPPLAFLQKAPIRKSVAGGLVPVSVCAPVNDLPLPAQEAAMSEKPEFSRPMALRRIGGQETSVTVEATEQECAAIARRLGLPKITLFRCRYLLKADRHSVVEAEGALAVHYTQTCVVSLENFEDVLAGAFSVRFVPSERFVEPDEPDLDAIDEIPYEGQDIDLGEAAVEQFALDLDPYPHAPEIDLPEGLVLSEEEAEKLLEEGEQDEKQNPFAALSRLKPGKA
ncbi:hypothetical protein APS_1418 [Acetobacter pasteurianus subsp. pasteurianus LMG 1262 = NBRC 106471]|nr:hypothetical protein APS_1418 [Acetobacter pasteurianus subsp. pasteurianus LMG 1262 = NBRC 106471]